jgi:outer membrane protein
MINFKNLIIAATILGMVSASSSLFAQTKIGYFNLVKVIESAPQAETALKQLETEFAPREQEGRTLTEQITKATEEREKNGLVWSDAERRDKDSALRDMQRDLTRLSEELREDYNLRRNEELAAIQQAVYQAVMDIANEESYDLILHEGAVVASPNVDITTKVLAKMGQL